MSYQQLASVLADPLRDAVRAGTAGPFKCAIASNKLLDYSAQQESFSGFLNREMATILSASAIDGNTCNRSMKS